MAANPKVVALIAAAGFFMQGLDNMIVTTAIPKMAVDFGVPAVQMGPIIMAYIAAVVIFTPVSGWLADRFGTRVVYQASIGIFTLGSILCAASHGLLELTAARLVQGIGGSMLVPIGRLAILQTAKRHEVVEAMAMLSILQQLGPLLGPPFGGFITTYWSWPWIFLVNVPVGAVAIAVTPRFLPNELTSRPKPFDWMGFLLVGTAVACLTAALSFFGEGGGSLVEALGFTLIGVAIGAFAMRHLRIARYPLVDLNLFKIPTFRVNMTGGSLFRIGAGATPFLLPLLFQVGLGMSAVMSGMLTFGSALGSILVRPLMPRLLRRFGFRNVLLGVGAGFPVLTLACGFFGPATPLAIVFVVLFTGGFLSTLQFSTLNAVAYADVEGPRVGYATGLGQLVQQFALGGGVALASVMLEAIAGVKGEGSPASVDFLAVFASMALISLSSVYFYVRMAPDAGTELSGHEIRAGGAAPTMGE